ncbi:haloacid dehalogenase type II [Ahrensia sp. R2A130]|uniref:haloacid dehalogenase type II n=1 Tax=Ahrensia sp. R2A130 TaxID=744979 RepID=UPI0001E0E0C4|nr:haloacid dehalogenase type II [Ahrensia sp. R2A130]EFL88924.1 haloacid dehalogenase, type II [Ahrensia sp. R2A130]
MPNTPAAYVFDAYGTLFDVHSAVRKYADQLGPDAAALSDMWRNKQLEYTWVRTLMGRYVDFWEITQQALDFAFARFPSAYKSVRDDLLDAYWELEAYSEVRDVLGKLQASGAKTAIFSNGSPDMLAAAVASADLDDVLDASISVHRLRQFKVVPSAYQLVCDEFALQPEDVSFQSSNRWDIAGAKAFRFGTVWCNRTGQPDEYADLTPDRVISDLTELL